MQDGSGSNGSGVEIKLDDAGIKIEKDKTYSADEVTNLITDAIKKGATISKNQLQDTIKKKTEEVVQAKADADTKKLEAETIKKENDDLQKKILDKENEVKTLADKSKDADEAKKELNELKTKQSDTEKKLTVMEEAGAQAIKKANDLETSIQKERMDRYKEQLITKANGRIIAEMVIGSTVEELEKSAEGAKKAYEKNENDIRGKFKLPSEEDEKKAKEEEGKPITVNKIDPTDMNAVNAWKKDRKKIIQDVYRKEGFDV